MARKKRELTASEMGRRGGAARWRNVSPKERSVLMTEAIRTRWRKAKERRTA